MRIVDCVPGTIVRYGRPKYLADPQPNHYHGNRLAGSCPALIVAVGRYTLTRSGHCGETMPAEVKTGTRKVVILRQVNENQYHRQYVPDNFKPITADTVWVWDVVNPTYLMTLEEWDIKTFPIFERQLEVSSWQRQYDGAKVRLKKAATAAIREHLGPLAPRKVKSGQPAAFDAGIVVESDGDGGRRIRVAVHFDLTEAQLRKLVGKEGIDEVLTLAANRPDACSL